MAQHTGRNWVVWFQGKSQRDSFLPDKSSGRSHCSFAELSLCRYRQVPYLHQPGLHSCPGDSLRPPLHPNLRDIQAASRGFFIQTTFLSLYYGLSYNPSKVHKPQTRSIWLQHAPYLLLSSLKPGTRYRWPQFTVQALPCTP